LLKIDVSLTGMPK